MPPHSSSSDKGPESLSEVLSRLFAARGWGRKQGRLRLEQGWARAAGEAVAKHTYVGVCKRGVLEILVDNPVLLQELASFQKRALLERVRKEITSVEINDLRFRVGVRDTPK